MARVLSIAAQQLHLNRHREILFLPHGFRRLAMNHDSAVPQGPTSSVRQLLADKSILHAQHVVRKRRLVEYVAEPVLKSGISVIVDAKRAILYPEGVGKVLSEL